MAPLHLERRLIELVLAHPSVAPHLHAPPESVVMPFAQERDRRYLMVSLLLREVPTLEVLALLSRVVVSAASESGLLSNVQGFEILFGFMRSGKPQRALRLSSLSSAIPQMERITAIELQAPHPHEGMTSIRYASELA
jgi:hypothetical protein